jgi:hypothetical protein
MRTQSTRVHATVTVRGDERAEDDELFVLGFGSPTNARMGGFGSRFGTIVDDD